MAIYFSKKKLQFYLNFRHANCKTDQRELTILFTFKIHRKFQHSRFDQPSPADDLLQMTKNSFCQPVATELVVSK